MIDSFKGPQRWLSNFQESPLHYDGRNYRNRESAYQAQKFIPDLCNTSLIGQFETTTGTEAKKLAKLHKDLIREDWLEVNLGIMSEIIHAHFVQNKEERIKLVATHPEVLVEGNDWHDYFWGVCNGQGKNWLGRLLMAERAYWLNLATNFSCEEKVA